MTFRAMPHIVSSDSEGRADVWSDEASLNCEDDVPVDDGGGVDDDAGAGAPVAIIEAVAMDNLERNKSNGYVVPANETRFRNPPGHAASKVGRTDRSDASKSTTDQSGGGIQLFLPIRSEELRRVLAVHHCDSGSPKTHLLELFIRRELDGTIRYDSNAIDPIPSHESLESLLFPNPKEASPHSPVLLARVPRLNLSTQERLSDSRNYNANRHSHWMILSRSSGETTVREAAPAIPPAMKYADTCGLSQGSGFNADAGADEELVIVWGTGDCLDVIAVLDKVGVEYRSWTDCR